MPWTLIAHPVKCQRGLYVSGLHVNLVLGERDREKKNDVNLIFRTSVFFTDDRELSIIEIIE